MKLKPGSIISAISGSMGGVTYAVATGGVVARRRAVGRRGTERRLRIAQSRLAHLANLWSTGLSDEQRKGWRMVETKPAQGMISFIGGNLARINAGLGVQIDPPASGIPLGLLLLSVRATAPSLALLYFSPPVLSGGARLYIYAARPTGVPISVRSTDMAFLGVSENGATSPVDIGGLLTARYGPLLEGRYLHCFVRVLIDDGGILGPGLKVTGPQGQIGPAVPPVEGDFMIPTITPHSLESIGTNLAAGVVAAPASAAWGADNRVELYPFVVSRNFVVQSVFAYNGATAAGSWQVGVYSETFQRVFASAETGQSGTNALQVVSVSPVVLAPGRYWMALGASLSTSTFFRSSLSVVNRFRAAGALQANNAYPLPSTLAPVAVEGLGPRIIGISELAGIF